MRTDYRKDFRFKFVHSFLKIVQNLRVKGHGKIKNFIAKIILPSPKNNSVIVPTIYNNINIIVNPYKDKSIDSTLYYYGTYEPGTINIIKNSVKQGDIFIDVGANIGLMTLVASSVISKEGKIIAFEPVPNTFKILLKNIALNNCKNTKVENCSIGAVNGKGKIYENRKEGRGMSSMAIDTGAEQIEHEITIIKLDDYCKNNSINKIKMIKIDVEGWELEVLKGSKDVLSKPNAPIICIEYSNTRPTFGGEVLDIYKYIKNLNNYSVYKLFKAKSSISKLVEITKEEELPKHDNLFCFLPEHKQNLQNLF